MLLATQPSPAARIRAYSPFIALSEPKTNDGSVVASPSNHDAEARPNAPKAIAQGANLSQPRAELIDSEDASAVLAIYSNPVSGVGRIRRFDSLLTLDGERLIAALAI